MNHVDTAKKQKTCCASVVAGTRTHPESRISWLVSVMEPLPVMQICLWSVGVGMEASKLLVNSGKTESSYIPLLTVTRH